MYFIKHYFICRPSDSTVSEGAGIEAQDCYDFAIGSSNVNDTKTKAQTFQYRSLKS